jgi:GNAT superfamily N-acetyltransferase
MDVADATPEHHAAVVDLVLRRSPSMTEALVRDTVHDPDATEERRLLTALDDGRLVGAGIRFRPRAAATGMGIEHVVVEEWAEGRAVASTLHAGLERQPLGGVTFLVGQAEADDTSSVAVARHWGYEVTEVSVTSRLDLGDTPRPLVPDDVTVEVSRSLEFTDADEVDEMLDLSQTNPERESGGALTLRALRSMADRGRAARPLALVLRVGGRPAAITLALLLDGEAQVFYTGVAPRFRGRGLALLAKRLLHAELAASGARSAVTNNAEDNRGIRGVNDVLGYRRTGAAAFLRRVLAGEHPPEA